jgi:CheY-like chemotaxis protein
MPVMDGMEATVKLIEMGVETPIIAVTANVLPEDTARYISAGMLDCLTKPFKQRDLWACLIKYLGPAERRKPIDTELGIENSAGDETLYKKLVQKFYDKQRERYDQIEEAVNRGDYDSAHMLAHKEGSVAAVIGASRLSATLRGLEMAFKHSDVHSLRELMDAYDKELDAVLGAIENIK